MRRPHRVHLVEQLVRQWDLRDVLCELLSRAEQELADLKWNDVLVSLAMLQRQSARHGLSEEVSPQVFEYAAIAGQEMAHRVDVLGRDAV